jgi:tetratricopeptide (TPR) repeat protein
LVKIPELKVTSRTSVFTFKGQNVDIPTVAKKLGVAHILEGSVRKAGNRVRITAQLIEAGNDVHLWSETYDRTLDDIFAIQDEIAATVVEQMKISLLGEAPKSDKIDPEAYSLFLQARFLRNQFTFNNLDRMEGLLDRAVAIAVYQKVLDIDPDERSALTRMGWFEMSWNNDLHAAAIYVQQAADQIADVEYRASQCYDMLQALGRTDVNLWVLEKRYEKNPASPHTLTGLAIVYTRIGRFSEAAEMAQLSLDLSPGIERGRQQINYALLRDGRPGEALKAIAMEPNDAYRLESLVMTYHDLGQRSDSETSLEQFLALSDVPAERYAMVYSHIGDKDLAFDWLERVRMTRPIPYTLFLHRQFDNLRNDSRWLPYLESIGQSPAQLAAVDFEFPDVP